MWRRNDAVPHSSYLRRMSRLVRLAQSRASRLDARDTGSSTVLGRRFRLVSVAFTTLVMAACRADSLTTPLQSTDCGDEPGCRPSQNVPVDPAVIAAVDDARERLAPTLDDAGARVTLTGALQALQQKLEANRSAEARVRLSMVFVELDRLRVTFPGEAPVDLPDMAAIRLAMVPVANALGVKIGS